MFENLEFRAKLYTEMSTNKKLRDTEHTLCNIDYDPEFPIKHGVLRFFENHLWTHDPRPSVLAQYAHGFEKTPTLPFLLFPFQEIAVLKICDCIDKGQDALIEKSRDMGVSWLVLMVLFWYWWKTDGGNEFLLGSRKIDFVDRKGATDTLFEKIRYNLYRLYPAFMPKKFNKNKEDSVNLLKNPANGNYFRGESNNENFGTSGRYKAIFMDEFSKWAETDEQAWTSTGDSSPCRIAVSTPFGVGTKFAQLRDSGAIEVITFHWSEHPIKGAGKYRGDHPIIPEKKDVWLSEWYLAECERRKDLPGANIGQELDIDYLTSGSPFFLEEMIKIKELERSLKGNRFDSFNFIRSEDTDIELIPYDKGSIVIKDNPVSGWSNRYVISADVAEGLEHGDNSSMYVYDRVALEDVAWFTGKIDTTVFALLLAYFGYMYDNAYIGVENNNAGIAVLKKLVEIYPYLMHQMDVSKEVDLEGVKLGWNTNNATRKLMLGELKNAIANDYHGIHDFNVMTECLTFVLNKNGKPEAASGKWDDRVFAQAIKWQVHKWAPEPKRIISDNTKKFGTKRFGGAVIEKQDIRKIWNN